MNGLEMSQIEKEESCRRAMTSLIRRPLRDALKKKTEAGNMALNILMQVKIYLLLRVEFSDQEIVGTIIFYRK